MTERSLASRSIRGVAWTVLLQGGEAALQAGSLVVLARLVSPEEFGLVGAALVVISFSQVFATFGIGPALVQREELHERHVVTAFWTSVLLGAACAVLIVVGAPIIARFFRMPDLIPILRVSASLFVVSAIATVAQSMVQRDLRFRELAFTGFASTLVGYGGVGIWLAAMGLGAWALLFANLTERLLRTVILLYLARHPWAVRFHVDAFRDLFNFGAGQTLAQFGSLVAREGDNLVVGRWLGADALGLYGRAYQLMVTPTALIGQGLNIVLFPAMAQIQSSKERLAAIYRRGLAGIHCATMPTSVLIIILAPEIIAVLLGDQWKGAVVPFQILSVGLALRTSTVLSESLVRALGAVYHGAWRQWVFAAAVTGGSIFGARWGIAGVASGVLGAIILKFMLLLQLSLRITNAPVRPLITAHGLPAVATLVALLATQVAVGVLRPKGTPLLTLAAAVSVWLVAVGGLLALARQLRLDNEGLWLFERFFTEFARKREAIQG